jgi:hypothetical protein
MCQRIRLPGATISVQFKRESSGEFWNLTKLLQTCAEVQFSRTHYLDKGKMTTMATQYLPSQKRKPINLHKLEDNRAQESDAQRYDFFSLKEHIRRIVKEDKISHKSEQVPASRERLQRQKTKNRETLERHMRNSDTDKKFTHQLLLRRKHCRIADAQAGAPP